MRFQRHLSVGVGDSSRRSDEIVKISNCAFECDDDDDDDDDYNRVLSSLANHKSFYG